MHDLRYFFIMASVTFLLFGCSAVKERKAFCDWQEEDRRWHGNDSGDVRLPEISERSSLDDYILYALLNNPGLEAAFEKWRAALERVTPARTLPDPRFTYANYIREVETRVGPQEHKFGLAQTFPWLGKLDLQGEIALQGAQIERQQYEAAKLDLIFRVKNIYYEFSYLAEAIDIANDNVTLLSYMESIARARYKGGAGLQSAVIKAQVELGKLEDRLHSLQDLMRPVRAKLNITLNRPSKMPIPLPKSLPDKKLDLKEETLFSFLTTSNPNLKGYDFMVAKEDLAIELSEKNYFPDVTLGVDYIDTASRTDMDPSDNGKDPVIAMVSVNLPFWQQKYNAIKAEALARRRAVEQEKKEKENMLIADLEMALFRLRDADRKIDLYRDTLLPKAEQSIKVTELAFSTDKATFLDLIDSQRILLGFQLEFKRALADRAQRLAEIEMLTGGDIERGVSVSADPTGEQKHH